MQNNFSIQANIYTLLPNPANGDKAILGKNINYVIPIYQRPYSWLGVQTEKFISDLFISFWGSNKVAPSEPMFIGTMQLSKLNKLNEHDIIDGQQRTTTFLILLKVLQLRYPNCDELTSIKLDWLSTEVNSGKQQELLENFIKLDNLIDDASHLNRYIENAKKIDRKISELIKPTSETHPPFNITDFFIHLSRNVYFVVIETKASLTKTLQIFDAINTTGLDLNAGDVFKIRMYEYLNPSGENDDIFKDISALYEKIDGYNAEFGEKVLEIKHILGIYQSYLIAQYQLPTDLYTFSTDLFFDNLFETLFNINKWEHFKGNVENGKVILSIKEIDSLIDIRFEWERKWRSGDYGNALNASMIHLWRWSRYSKYSTFIFLHLYQNRDKENKYDLLYDFSIKLVKLYLIYSIYYQKSINNIKGPFNSELVKQLVHGSHESVLDVIENRINNISSETRDRFYNLITDDILYSRKLKNILCRLSALLEEDYHATNHQTILEIKSKLFTFPIDIEHIQSYNDEDVIERNIIKEEWGNNLNSIGNLVVLEQSLNRSINNRASEKLVNYKKSDYNIVNRRLVELYPGWNLEKCKQRKCIEADKLFTFLFDINN